MRKPWTEEDDDHLGYLVLMKLHLDAEMEKVAKRLGRRRVSVYGRVQMFVNLITHKRKQ